MRLRWESVGRGIAIKEKDSKKERDRERESKRSRVMKDENDGVWFMSVGEKGEKRTWNEIK